MLIDFDYIVKKYNMNIKGILHVGAHECEEFQSYVDNGIDVSRQLWIEALTDKVDFCKNKIKDLNIINTVVSDIDDQKIIFNITNNYQSSSILNLKTHLLEYPYIHVINKIELFTKKIKTLYDTYKIEYSKYNFLNLDIQGAELLAMKGMENIIDFFDYIYLEVNEKELYENCALLPEIDSFLKDKGFSRYEIIITDSGWGDALYIRDIKKIAIDIGSNIGNWSKTNSNNYNKIITVEGSPNTYKQLCLNLDSPKFENLNYVVHISKNINFYECDANTLSTTNLDWLCDTKSRFFNTPYKQISVETITIDKLVQIYGIPDIIKIDVEGGEYECIKSLKQKVPLLCFEWASETNDITFNCIDYLKSIGFNNFYLQDKDEYTFFPKYINYSNIDYVKQQLSMKIPKIDWGMLWCY